MEGIGDDSKKETVWWKRICCCCCCDDENKKIGRNKEAAAFQTTSAFDRYKVEGEETFASSPPRQEQADEDGFGNIGDHFVDLCDNAPTPGFMPGVVVTDGD